jgi:mannose-6-phosphate isomerase-like protein (cupin superfamily)
MSGIFRAEEQPRRISCGLLRRILGKEDCDRLDFADVEVLSETKRHYHNKATEFYYVLEGKLEIDLDGQKGICEQGDLVMITPGTRHKARALGGKARLLVACCPPWEESDEIPAE